MGGACIDNPTAGETILMDYSFCPGRFIDESWCQMPRIVCFAHGQTGTCTSSDHCIEDAFTTKSNSADCPENDHISCCHARSTQACYSTVGGYPGVCRNWSDCRDSGMGGKLHFANDEENVICDAIGYDCCYDPYAVCTSRNGFNGVCSHDLSDCENDWEDSSAACAGYAGCCYESFEAPTPTTIQPTCTGPDGEYGSCVSFVDCLDLNLDNNWDSAACSDITLGCCYTPTPMTPPTIACTGPNGESGSCLSFADCNIGEWDSNGCGDGRLGCCYIPDGESTPAPPSVQTISRTTFYFVGTGSTIRGYPDNNHITFELTRPTAWQAGGAWCKEDYRVDVTHSFEFYFEANFGSVADGGDGIVFVIQNDAKDALETTGGHFLGYGFKPGNRTSERDSIKKSIGVEFDTFNYPDTVEDRNEIEEDHIAILVNGNILAPVAGGPVEANRGQANIKDGNWHDIWVKYELLPLSLGTTGLLNVYFDNHISPRLVATIELRPTVGSDLAYWGFTAATGDRVTQQKITMHQSTYLKYLDSVARR